MASVGFGTVCSFRSGNVPPADRGGVLHQQQSCDILYIYISDFLHASLGSDRQSLLWSPRSGKLWFADASCVRPLVVLVAALPSGSVPRVKQGCSGLQPGDT